MTTAFKSILRNVGFDIFNIEPTPSTAATASETSKDFFIIGIGLNRTSNYLLQNHLNGLGIKSFMVSKNFHNKSKIKAMAHAGKIKFSENETHLMMPRKDFYWDQIFETRKKKFNGFIGLPAMNFCTDLLDYYKKTHECRVIFLNENVSHWHRPVFENLYSLENLGFAKDDLDYLLYPQIELVRQMTANYKSDIEAAKKQSQNAFENAIANLKNQIPSELIFEYNLSDGIAPLSQFLGIKEKKNVFGW